jgi:hypothetical protein
MEYQQIPNWELLTRACLSETRNEIKKISFIWSQNADPHDMDYKSMRLIPYFLDHLKKHSIPVPHEKRLKVIYKYWWLKSKWILHELDRITDLFHSNGIPLMVIKGAALHQIYEKPIHRTMVDIDLLVEKKHVLKAYELLSINGFIGIDKSVVMYRNCAWLLDYYHHAFCLKEEKLGLEIDLHWKLGNNLPTEITQYAWEKAIPDKTNIKRQLPSKHLLFIINAFNGYMSQEHHGNWLLDSKLLLSSLSTEEMKKLKNFLSLHHFDIWPHINFYLSQFGILFQPINKDFKQNLTLMPIINSIRSQSTFKKKIKTFIQSYKSEAAIRNLTNRKSSFLKFVLWKVSWVVFPIKEKKINESGEQSKVL